MSDLALIRLFFALLRCSRLRPSACVLCLCPWRLASRQASPCPRTCRPSRSCGLQRRRRGRRRKRRRTSLSQRSVNSASISLVCPRSETCGRCCFLGDWWESRICTPLRHVYFALVKGTRRWIRQRKKTVDVGLLVCTTPLTRFLQPPSLVLPSSSSVATCRRSLVAHRFCLMDVFNCPYQRTPCSSAVPREKWTSAADLRSTSTSTRRRHQRWTARPRGTNRLVLRKAGEFVVSIVALLWAGFYRSLCSCIYRWTSCVACSWCWDSCDACSAFGHVLIDRP